jgi:cytochrome c-type biogenesis protein
VALFAPCCIVFMFPAYLSAAVRNRRWRLVPLTFVFAAGLAVVLVPVTLGIGLLTRPLLRYHGFIYFAGGLLLIVLGALAAVGKTWSLPMLRGSPDIQRTDSAGVFALGVFSGAASSCCAPVLAGVVTLSAVAPSVTEATLIGLGYVFGMVFPLMLVTLLWDRSKWRERGVFRGREVTWRLAGRTFVTNSIGLMAAAMFGLMGVGLVVVAITGATLAPSAQVGFGNWLQERLVPLVEWLEPIPDFIVAIGLVGLAVAAISISGRRRSPPESNQLERSCHEQPEEAAADSTFSP